MHRQERNRALCHTDSNPSNFIEADGRLVAVDWDAGGIGDPTFELAELSTHPTIPFSTDGNWQRWIEMHYRSEAVDYLQFRQYRLQMALWWTARLLRQRHELPTIFGACDEQRVADLLEYMRRADE
jgi:thiamine kinase-like enzyme